MTRMTRPDCAVMCNLINIHTYIHTYIHKGEGAPWYTGVLLGAERFMASWHKSEEEASKLREVNRAA